MRKEIDLKRGQVSFSHNEDVGKGNILGSLSLTLCREVDSEFTTSDLTVESNWPFWKEVDNYRQFALINFAYFMHSKIQSDLIIRIGFGWAYAMLCNLGAPFSRVLE